MDFNLLSLATGFIIGTLTGASGSYLGEKYTDRRRKKEARTDEEKEWKSLCLRFPKIIDEMKDDVQNPKYYQVRKFFVKDSQSFVCTE